MASAIMEGVTETTIIAAGAAATKVALIPWLPYRCRCYNLLWSNDIWCGSSISEHVATGMATAGTGTASKTIISKTTKKT